MFFLRPHNYKLITYYFQNGDAEVNEELNTIKEIIDYVDTVEPNDGYDSTGNTKYIIWYCGKDYVNSSYSDWVPGKMDPLTSKSFDKYVNQI